VATITTDEYLPWVSVSHKPDGATIPTPSPTAAAAADANPYLPERPAAVPVVVVVVPMAFHFPLGCRRSCRIFCRFGFVHLAFRLFRAPYINCYLCLLFCHNIIPFRSCLFLLFCCFLPGCTGQNRLFRSAENGS
jgi:hypothetical protein